MKLHHFYSTHKKKYLGVILGKVQKVPYILSVYMILYIQSDSIQRNRIPQGEKLKKTLLLRNRKQHCPYPYPKTQSVDLLKYPSNSPVFYRKRENKFRYHRE